MDSITEEELLQMVRDFIESESASPISSPSSKALSHNDHHLPYLALQVYIYAPPMNICIFQLYISLLSLNFSYFIFALWV